MKFKHSSVLVLALLALCASARATVTFEITAALLSNSTGTGIPDGSTIFLVASNNGTFAAPIAGNLNPGSVWGNSINDMIVAAFAATGNTNFGVPGAIDTLISNLNYTSFPGFGAGDDVGLFWFPTVTYSSAGTVVNNGNAYGDFTTLSSGSDAASWILPPDQTSSHTLTLQTSNAGDATGGIFSNGNDVLTFNTVVAASPPAVPEPSAYALLGGLVGLTAAVVRRRKFAATVAV